MKGIVEAQLVSDMPGSSKIRDRRNAPAVHRSGIKLVAQIGARFTAKNGLVVPRHTGVPARVTYASGEIQVLPIIRLHCKLFGRRICSRAPMVQIAVEIGAARGIHKSGGEKRSRAGLTGAGVERNSQVRVLSGVYRKGLRKIRDSRIAFVVVPDLV